MSKVTSEAIETGVTFWALFGGLGVALITGGTVGHFIGAVWIGCGLPMGSIGWITRGSGVGTTPPGNPGRTTGSVGAAAAVGSCGT